MLRWLQIILLVLHWCAEEAMPREARCGDLFSWFHSEDHWKWQTERQLNWTQELLHSCCLIAMRTGLENLLEVVMWVVEVPHYIPQHSSNFQFSGISGSYGCFCTWWLYFKQNNYHFSPHLPILLCVRYSLLAEGPRLVPVSSLFYSFVGIKVRYTTEGCLPATRIASVSN